MSDRPSGADADPEATPEREPENDSGDDTGPDRTSDGDGPDDDYRVSYSDPDADSSGAADPAGRQGMDAEAGPDSDGGTDADSRTVRPTLRDESDPDSVDADVDADSGSRSAGPLGDLAATVERRRAEAADPASGSPSDEFDDLFERKDVAELDPDRLWERLEGDDSEPADLFEDEREIRTVDKREYCHQCEHFATPPNVGCTLEGTDILDMPELDRFRVADCPVVLEDEELERRY